MTETLVEIGYDGELPVLSISTGNTDWILNKLDGFTGDPGMLVKTAENPNGGDYVFTGTARKPSRQITVNFTVINDSEYGLYQAAELINSIAANPELLTIVVTQTFTEAIVETTITNCRLNDDILTNIKNNSLDAQFTLISKTGTKTVSITTLP